MHVVAEHCAAHPDAEKNTRRISHPYCAAKPAVSGALTRQLIAANGHHGASKGKSFREWHEGDIAHTGAHWWVGGTHAMALG